MVALAGTVLTGALFLVLAGPSSADVYPGNDAFDELCQEISINVTKNSIHLWELKKECKGWWSGCTYYLKLRDILTKASICSKLTAQHNDHNAAYLDGVTISSVQCVAAMTAPKFYKAENWNEWSGKHCGTWKSTNAKGAVTMTFIDNALWYSAQPMGRYFRQSVKFLTRKCCTAGWNASGGKEIVVWGWDPKEMQDHYGYQGTHVGYPFSQSGAECIVWLTGEEAFLECVKETESGKRRTSAGFWGFGQWKVVSMSAFCKKML